MNKFLRFVDLKLLKFMHDLQRTGRQRSLLKRSAAQNNKKRRNRLTWRKKAKPQLLQNWLKEMKVSALLNKNWLG